MSFYQRNQHWIFYSILIILSNLIILGIMFLYNLKSILKCLCLSLLLLFFAPLQSCKVTQSTFFQTAKAFTKAQIKQLYPESNLERDSLVLVGEFAPEKVYKVLGEKTWIFLTPMGEMKMQTLDFLAYISWSRTPENDVRIEILYIKPPRAHGRK